MKRVSRSDLARVAMSKGAVVSLDGTRINASGERQAVGARPAPEPVAQPVQSAPARQEVVHQVKTDPVQVNTASVERALAAQTQASTNLVGVVGMLVEQMARQQSGQSQKRGWRFTIERDADGRIADIIAKQE